MPFYTLLRRYRNVIAGTVFVFVVFTVVGLQVVPLTQSSETEQLSLHSHSPPSREPSVSKSDGLLPFPPEYQQAPEEQPFCADRFGSRYLQNLAKTSVSYCDNKSASTLTCFRTQVDPNGRIDSFCVGESVAFEKKENKFKLDCNLREWSAEGAANGIPDLYQFPRYWYATGPFFIFRKYIQTGPKRGIRHDGPKSPRNFSILIKREDSQYNIWHSLMEIFALYQTLDVLRITRNPATNTAFFSTEDFDNTQVIILDSLLDGPYFDLWTLFAKKAVIRLSELPMSTQTNFENVIVPLPGGANVFWQGDWEPFSCGRSELLHTFSQRVLDFYKIDNSHSPDDRPLKLTFVDRQVKRRLIDKARYIETLKVKFPAVKIQVVDFASLSFSDQLKIVSRTDVLVGVHGAGLTHGMFLPPHSTMAEIFPPSLNHKGFRNLAKKLGHNYFSSHGVDRPTNATKTDWQTDDVFIEEDRFMDLMDLAIRSMYNRGLLDSDVN